MFVIAFVCFFAANLLWSLASPLRSSPDEPAHFIRAAAVVRGDVTGHPKPGEPWLSESLVPKYVADTQGRTCYAYQPDVSASCDGPVDPDDTLTPAVTTANSNHPLFYLITGIPTLFLDGNAALYGMRAMSVLLNAAMLAIATMSLWQLPRARFALFGLIAGFTPMVAFLSGTLNPNGVEVTAAVALVSVLLLTLRRPSTGGILWERGAMVVLATLLLTSTRSISLLWLLVIVAAALLAADWRQSRSLFRRPAAIATVAASAVVTVGALVWFRTPLTTYGDGGQTYPEVGTGYWTGFLKMLVSTFDYAQGWIGLFGWIDTALPLSAMAIWTVAAGSLVVAAFVVGRGRALLAPLLLIAVLILVPAFVQAALVTEMGYIWQGRYTLAMFAVLLVLCGVVVDDGAPSLRRAVMRRLAALALIGLVVAHVIAFVNTLRRYTIGSQYSFADMLGAVSWQPPGGWAPLSLAYVVVLGLGGFLMWRHLVRPAVEVPDASDPATGRRSPDPVPTAGRLIGDDAASSRDST